MMVRYAVAVLAAAVATAARWLLRQYFGDSYPFALIFLAVIFSAWYGGFGPALLTAMLGLGSTWLLSDSRQSSAHPFLGLGMYFVFSLGIAALGGFVARARERIARQIEELTCQQAELRLATSGRMSFWRCSLTSYAIRSPRLPARWIFSNSRAWIPPQQPRPATLPTGSSSI